MRKVWVNGLNVLRESEHRWSQSANGMSSQDRKWLESEVFESTFVGS